MIKTITYLNKYDVVPIKEIDIDENIKDYKSRLFQHSPLRKNKKAIDLKRKSHDKKNLTFKSANHDLVNSILQSLPVNKQSEKDLNIDKDSSQIKLILKKNKVEISAKSSPMKNNFKTDVIKNHVNNSCSSLNYTDNEESQDDIQVEMNKISIIERIKNYIL